MTLLIVAVTLEDIQKLKAKLDDVQNDVTAVQNDVTAVQNDVSSVQDDFTAVQDDVSAIQEIIACSQIQCPTLGKRLED